jgi:hypothetical protein
MEASIPFPTYFLRLNLYNSIRKTKSINGMVKLD